MPYPGRCIDPDNLNSICGTPNSKNEMVEPCQINNPEVDELLNEGEPPGKKTSERDIWPAPGDSS